MLRAMDFLMLRVEVGTDHYGEVFEEGQTRRSKTGTEAQIVLKDKARDPLVNWIAESGKFAGDNLLASLRKDIGGKPITRVQ